MQQGVTFTPAPVTRWRTEGPWRATEKRARLDERCDLCRLVLTEALCAACEAATDGI